MNHEIVMAGFGGQGVMLIGQLMTYGGMLAQKQVSWIPSYGPEMRGGTANCSVIVADEPIGSPIVTEPTAIIVMNLPSLDKFESVLSPGGVLIINSSLIVKKAGRSDITVYYVPANDLAHELGNAKAANMVMLGALLAATDAVDTDPLLQALEKMFAKRPALLDINKQALQRGYRHIDR